METHLKRQHDADSSEQSKRSRVERELPLSISSIEKLPCELTWKIIEKVPEMVLLLRMSSRTMYSCVNDYAMQRGTRPIVKDLKIFGNGEFYEDKPTEYSLDIEMIVLLHKLPLLQLRILLRNRHPGLHDLFESTIREAFPNQIFLKINISTNNDDMLDFMGDCIGRRVETALIGTSVLSRPVLMASSKLLEKINSGSMTIHFSPRTLTDDFVDIILKRIRTERLYLSVARTRLSDPEGTLLHLSSNVRAIRIDQQRIDEINRTSNYFFGIHDAEWSPIILEMYSRMLDKLCIINYASTGFLSNKSAQAVIEKLPQLDKKVWFEATSKNFPEGLNYTDCDYVVDADRSSRHVSYLRIKHSSRKDEIFP